MDKTFMRFDVSAQKSDECMRVKHDSSMKRAMEREREREEERVIRQVFFKISMI